MYVVLSASNGLPFTIIGSVHECLVETSSLRENGYIAGLQELQSKEAESQSELAILSQRLGAYESHVKGGVHQVSGRDLPVAFCASGVCREVSTDSHHAPDEEMGRENAGLVGKDIADISTLSYPMTSKLVAELLRCQYGTPPFLWGSMLRWSSAEVAAFVGRFPTDQSE